MSEREPVEDLGEQVHHKLAILALHLPLKPIHPVQIVALMVAWVTQNNGLPGQCKSHDPPPNGDVATPTSRHVEVLRVEDFEPKERQNNFN